MSREKWAGPDPKDAQRCVGALRGGGSSWASTPRCKSHGKVKRGRQWYCGTHDPVRRRAAEEKRNEARLKDRRRSNKVWERRGLETRACAGLTDDELKLAVSNGGLKELWLDA